MAKKDGSSKKRRRDRDEVASLKSMMGMDFLDQLVDYVFADNVILGRRSFRQLYALMSSFELEDFQDNIDAQVRVYIISKIALKRAESAIPANFDTLVALIKSGGVFDTEIDDVLNGVREKLPNDWVIEIDNLISERLKYSGILGGTNKMQDILLRIQNNDYTDLQSFMTEEVEPVFCEMWKELKKVRGLSADTDKDFDFSLDSFTDALVKTHTIKNSSSCRVKTGIQKLNEMVGGSLEGGRVYNVLGLTGKGKSKILLSLAYQCWKNNQDMTTLDPSLKPAFLYITAENDIFETYERLAAIAIDMSQFNEDMITEDTDFLKDLTLEELKDLLIDSGVINNEKCNLYVKYRKNRTISTLDIQGMIDDAKMDGFEIRGVFVDYTKRINSIEKIIEENERLGAITNDFSTLAKENNCFVFSAGQLNRAAMKQLEEMIAKGKVNLGQKLQSSDIGGSWAIIENSDVVIIINPEDTIENDGSIRSWMTFNRVKSRSRTKKVQYFAHPFHRLNGMQLLEDINSRNSLSVEQILESNFSDEEEGDTERTGSSIRNRRASNVHGSEGSRQGRRRKVTLPPSETFSDGPEIKSDNLAAPVAAADLEKL